MLYSITLACVAAILPVLAEELGAEDVPPACKTICEPIATLTNICNIDPNEGGANDDKRRGLHLREVDEADEPIEASCICTNKSFDVASVMALCAGCLTQNGAETEDADKIMSQCSFTSTSADIVIVYIDRHQWCQ
ncbi:uncharacterized protein DNG_08080 [Cephalotrichum gorgonifer]|uniref:Uncharacterized protein n=1 Tax=Cephalotrichum gorgonifer TaxID=2041049 RepID=A0AAE8N5E3_9PEZI|nr:uncharacterized protein DNG_08080 [Cephalotrichum gorgonifer]